MGSAAACEVEETTTDWANTSVQLSAALPKDARASKMNPDPIIQATKPHTLGHKSLWLATERYENGFNSDHTQFGLRENAWSLT